MVKVKCSDYELVRLVREQDKVALDTLIKKYSLLKKKIAYSYRGIGIDPEDFFQEGQLAFIQSIYTYDQEAEFSFYSYSMTCVRNAIITEYRRVKRSAGLDLLTDYSTTEVCVVAESQASYLDRGYFNLDEKLFMEYAFKKEGFLSDFEKMCLKYYLLDNTYIEIAQMLSVPPKKVDNALQRCKMKLKALNKNSSSTGQYC